ncbi:MAG: GNAT family N-acetyltransferase [Hyphomicrobiaceae bacterium]
MSKRKSTTGVSNAASEPTLTLSVVSEIASVPAADWDRLANPVPTTFNPFVAHAFLKALEDSGCVGPRTGWQPQHLVLRRDGGEDAGIVGLAPAYLKSHSKGEYVFDYGWAEAFERAGGRYYPKLQIAVPFTPVPGPRLLAGSGADADRIRQALASGAAQVARRNGISSVHATFLTDAEMGAACEVGYLHRTDQQFHWQNRGYVDFETFLQTLSSRKRKAIRRERSGVVEAGIEVRTIEGAAITEAHWDAVHAFYMDTGGRKWGRPYLNRAFFSRLGETMAEHCVIVLATRDGRPIAGALNLKGGDCLYGRYWGSTEHHPFLHFEVCYYQAIEYAIRHHLPRVEAGAQGEHKLMRGYLPTPTHSVHWIADRGFRQAVARYLDTERHHVAREIEALAEYAPYKRGATHEVEQE